MYIYRLIDNCYRQVGMRISCRLKNFSLISLVFGDMFAFIIVICLHSFFCGFIFILKDHLIYTLIMNPSKYFDVKYILRDIDICQNICIIHGRKF